MSKNALFINLIGGPGTGKSTIASAIFSELKWNGIDCEIVSEYAKQLVWEQSFQKMKNQIYIFGKQHNKMWALKEQVDIVVTDAPILLGLYYSGGENPALEQLVESEHHKFNNLNVFLKRKKGYNPNGRTQTEEQAKAIDKKLKEILISKKIDFVEVTAEKKSVELIVKLIKEKLNGKKRSTKKIKTVRR